MKQQSGHRHHVVHGTRPRHGLLVGPFGRQSQRRSSATGNNASGEPRRILYYRDAMGHDDTSPVPKKDAMGMDYVPVYADDAPEGPQVNISLESAADAGRAKRAGCEPRRCRTRFAPSVRSRPTSAGLYTVSPKFEGWIRTLYVNTTGAEGHGAASRCSPSSALSSSLRRRNIAVAVEALKSMGDASPEARAGMQALVDGGLQRLRNWDICR